MAESVVLMIVFSIFAEAGCGATFGITPAVDPKNTGAVYGAGACWRSVVQVYLALKAACSVTTC